MSIGDVNSNARGSGARFNTSKLPYELLPVGIIGEALARCAEVESHRGPSEIQMRCSKALLELGAWQEGGNSLHLIDALLWLGDGWDECAEVFDYGRAKYLAWNWAKGMAWSVPLACATRHLMAMARGEPTDPESGKAHRGHVYCNLVMLLTYEFTYPEGDDRPALLKAVEL